MNKVKVRILKPIIPQGWSSAFHPQSSRLIYDSASPRKRKQHQLIYQQGSRYGTVGDMCEYLSHDDLLALERDGFVRIDGRIGR